MTEAEKSEVRWEKCIHYESHIKAIAEGKLGDAFCMLECNGNHSAFEEKKITMLSDEEKANNYELDCIADVHKDDVCTILYAYSAQKLEQAYLDGLAEGRKEKCFEQNKDGTIRPCEVMKENEELKEQLKNNPYVQILQKEKAEMAEDFAKQIEKMKNVGNCSKAMKCSKWVEQHIKGNKVTCCCGCKEWGSAE